MLRAGLEATGGRVQAYTSPHLARFHERIRLADGLIGEAGLAALLEECERVNGAEPITFFEITTAAALVAFARAPADWCLLEVGLGGRLDATNVVDRPRLTAITPVDLDHQQYLGETIAEIAGEKAGILKPGVPCVVGPQHPEALAVIRRRADAVGAPLVVAGAEFDVRAEAGGVVYEDRAGRLRLPLPALRGAHQVANAGIALAALRALGQGEATAEAAMLRAEWPARMQRLEARHGLELWLDGGHNPAAARMLAAGLAELPKRETVLVTGMLANRPPAAFLAELAGQAGALLAVPIPGEAKAHAPAVIVEAAQGAGLAATEAKSLEAALQTIARDHPGARVVICGSLYLAGAVLAGRG